MDHRRPAHLPRLALKRSAVPDEEPLSLDEAKDHLREDGDDQDNLIESLILASRQWLEEDLGRSFVTQTWVLKLDRFPAGDTAILLPRPPLVSVSSIAYVDEDGVTQTWAADNYTVDSHSEPGRVTLAYGASWPTTRDVPNAVTVTYVAGYGASTEVPEPIKAAMRLLIGHLYENREHEVTGTVVARLGFSLAALTAPYRVMWM